MRMRDGLLLGLIIGVGAAILYAPKSGKEIRNDVHDKLNVVPKNFFTLLESLVDLSVSVLDFAKEALQEQSDKFSDVFSRGLDVAKDKTDELKKYASSVSSN